MIFSDTLFDCYLRKSNEEKFSMNKQEMYDPKDMVTCNNCYEKENEELKCKTREKEELKRKNEELELKASTLSLSSPFQNPSLGFSTDLLLLLPIDDSSPSTIPIHRNILNEEEEVEFRFSSMSKRTIMKKEKNWQYTCIYLGGENAIGGDEMRAWWKQWEFDDEAREHEREREREQESCMRE
ncbi:hypothetical protein RJT34_22388 [Clitoria ternatea]|uniref:Uncharacterized protein n=1 Tax=Clitoria ternatea TaxID=43366 RepID=A0AAN9IW54_CLITE